ncbi:glycoside hydrolase family 9 protein [Massilia pseudoviolaceinigra]|uniref:glycoside hydrolase family 9 protein n=1 Tax=Massilia pseudoviolaceinigra TaxID=3057165 RepID=UPI002796BEA2|nr:glycoside hydrolase family 9 protein [Massilia sp. CCM 9206]MDQ1924289.1 glycoside hydrolase family 9 protein [Massilia sp. CCM 9206]
MNTVTLSIVAGIGASVLGVSFAQTAGAIVSVHAAAPQVIVVELQTATTNEAGGTATRPDALDLALTRWTVNGQAPLGISRMSTPYDEQKALATTSPNLFPVTVRHKIYLRLDKPLAQGQPYTIATPYGATRLAFDNRATWCESIKVNQTGYSKLASSRFANFGAYLGNAGSLKLPAGSRYEVIDERSGRTVLGGEPQYIKDDTATASASSGEHVYRLRLDQLPEGGPYFVSVPGCGRSRSFAVGNDASRKIAYVLARGLYHQRCGTALKQPYTRHTREMCHATVADTRTPWVSTPKLSVPDNAVMHPLIGGHHDAGDFDRRPMHTIIPILMLSYFDAFPTHFVDRQYNIPESGNGIPDFVDEALWAVLSWENLQVMDSHDPQFGGVRAGTEMNRHPAYGVHSAASDPGRYGTWAVSEEVTALSAGIFAHAARVIRPHDPVRANALVQRARLAWRYLEKTATPEATKARFMYGALQLYLATGEARYHSLFKNAAQAIVIKNGTWPEQYLPGNASAAVQSAHFVSYLTAHGRAVDPALAQALKDRIVYFADRGGYVGPPPESQAYPQGATAFLAWGATTTQGKYADVYAFASLFAANAGKKQAYINAVSQYADFSLGLNPLGRSFVTGLGTDTPQSPAHLDSYFTKYGLADGAGANPHVKAIGNVPGIVVYGPTEGRSGAAYQTAVSNKLYPAWDKLPGLRRWGDGWSLINSNEFSTWETMVWNAAMHGFLYNASQDPEATSIAPDCDGATCPPTKPNACVIEPTTGALVLSGLATNIVCVQRTDNWAQQPVVNGKARFATPRAVPGTRVYGFSGMNSYGACTTKVVQLTCETP